MDGIIKLQIWQLAAAYLFVLVLIVIVRSWGLSREREIILSTLRMTLQLTLTGYLLVYLFASRHPLYTILAIAAMQAFAVHNIYQRAKVPLSRRLKKIIALSMTSGTLVSTIYFILVVIDLSPWYEPRYFIPIAGMLIGNAMTGISLGVNRLVDGMHSQHHLIEAALMLGATPRTATRAIVAQAFDAAILPSINSMVGMGMVFLPGMMTGQILSGVSPVTAVEYQIAIMLGILGSVAMTAILFVRLGYQTFFNREQQLEAE